jgi:predicted TIM-barrel fold metal-dependent hydrolase
MMMMTPREFSRDLLIAATGAFFIPRLRAQASGIFPGAVDGHAHIFLRTLPFAAVHRYVPDYDAPLDNYLRELDEHSIAHGVLIQPSFLGTDNEFMRQALRRAPDRLRGIAVVDPTLSSEELARLGADGIVGIRLNLVGVSIPDFQSALWQKFLARLVGLDWLVEVHREARDLPLIIGPLLAAGLKVVVDHFGRPDPKLGVDDPGFRYLLDRGGSRRLWVKLSGAYRNGSGGRGEQVALAAVPLLRGALGLDHLIWGSDWPHTQFEKVASYGSARAALDRWLPNAADRQAVLCATPGRLFRFSWNATSVPN